MNQVSPKSAYVHVPFCRHRCGYCNFSVIADRDDLIDRFIDALDVELASLGEPADAPPKLQTLFIGGGTPSHLPPKSLQRFFRVLHHRLDLSAVVEFSIEANPEDICVEKLRVFADQGVNRLSLGIQSFDENKLRLLERSHSRPSAIDAIETAASVIENLSIDLIFAAPGESVDDWRQDLQTATALPITHISTYALTFEKGAAFWSRRGRGELVGVGERVELAMYDLTRHHLSENGFAHYEISNFARSRLRCQHNLAYWNGDPWFAVGPGAAAFVQNVRSVNHRSTFTYLKRIEAGESPVAESEHVSDVQLARERAAFGVRMIDGIDFAQIEKETGVDLWDLCRSEIHTLQSQALITVDESKIVLTERGLHFADTVAAELLG